MNSVSEIIFKWLALISMVPITGFIFFGWLKGISRERQHHSRRRSTL